MSLAGEVRHIISEIAEADPAAIGDDTSLKEVLEIDSMMVLEIMSAIEARYDVKIPDEKAKDFTSLSAIVTALAEVVPSA